MQPNDTQPADLKLEFTHRGITRTLVKHPAIRIALRRGQLSSAEAAFKPWYMRLKVGGRERLFKLSCVDKDALRAAKDTLNGQLEKPAEFMAWMAEREARRGVTIEQLATEWRQLGYPDTAGRPRTSKSATPLEQCLALALRYWGAKRATSAGDHFLDFATWRRDKCTKSGRGTGDRSIDLELCTLSCLCKWAVAAKKIDKNPFAGVNSGGNRQRFHDPENVRHCHEFMPASDEVWHQVLKWFWTAQYDAETVSRHKTSKLDMRTRIAGAWLAFCGLTGLRPEEPQYLFRHASLPTFPTSPDKLPPGTIFPTRDGQRKMKVIRNKHGQNPYVLIHPAAADFLEAWSRWLVTNIAPVGPGVVQPWFPHPSNPIQPICTDDFSVLNKRLADACHACHLPQLKPKGFGRAFYVRVRRSQGHEDSMIASELGQTTKGELIREVYGDPDDMVGGALFDWLPEDDKQQPTNPAWKLLTPAAADNIITL